MTTLYIHTDATGLPKWKLPSTHPDQPHMLRLAMCLDDDGARSLIIKPGPEWVFERGAVEQHHITRTFAEQNGASLDDVLDALHKIQPDRIVAYNADFHRHMLERSAEECSRVMLWDKSLWSCVMRRATPICRVPRMMPGGGYSFPKMTVAYQHMTGHEMRLPDDPTDAGCYLVEAVRDIDLAIEKLTAPEQIDTMGDSSQ